MGEMKLSKDFLGIGLLREAKSAFRAVPRDGDPEVFLKFTEITQLIFRLK